jgi:hypothetical protein
VEQLAEMIARKINVAGVEIAVRRDYSCHWTPTILSAPSDPIGFKDVLRKSLEICGSNSTCDTRIRQSADESIATSCRGGRSSVSVRKPHAIPGPIGDTGRLVHSGI